MAIVTLTDENFSTEVLHSPTPVLVDFWSQQCPPCRALVPILDELAAEYDGRGKVAKLSIDDFLAKATEYQIRAVPTLLIFQNGQVVDQFVGLRSKRDFKAKLDRVAQA